MKADKINGINILLRNIEIADCNNEYLSWLENPVINQYLETRWVKQDLCKIKSFVRDINESDNSVLFAIIQKYSNKHIGNIKIGPININHKFSDISYFIGDTNSWGMGYATEAVELASSHGLKYLELETLLAGVYESNIGSQRVLEKSGYTLYGKIPKQFLCANGERDSQYLYCQKRG